MKQLLLSFFLPFILFSCGGKQPKNTVATNKKDSLEIRYATGFSVYYTGDYKQVVVHHPWEKGAVYANYYLVERPDTQVPTDGVKILIPLQTIAPVSATHFEFLSLLDELHSVTGVCRPELIYHPVIRENAANGQLVNLGDAFHINVEKTLELNPDAVMTNGMNQIDANTKRVSQAGIPVIFNNEWTETSLLGRAEWIKFVGAFYNKETAADSIFRQIEGRYQRIKEKAGKVAHKPSIMAGSNFRGTWYMPAGNSFMGQLFADGGANYYYADDTSTGSLPLNVESVLQNFAETDYWLNCNYGSIDELLKADRKHQLFRPVKLRQAYNFNKRMLPSGANDFWESAVARPDLLLADVIAILHPEILPEHELFYAEKLD
jgi:iron complex transport system substrate-binding protein